MAQTKKIAVLTMVRNAEFYLPKWLEYYASTFGVENLTVIFDGQDQAPPEGLSGFNVLRLPRVATQVVAMEKRRAGVLSGVAAGLLQNYDLAIAVDVDEFLVVDPRVGQGLADYLSAQVTGPSLSGLGLDVVQHLTEERALDRARPWLSQRRYAQVSARYTKPNVISRPLRWGSGMHRVKGHNFRIDPNLYLFHFGMVDHAYSMSRSQNTELLATGWGRHMQRRDELFHYVTGAQALEGDAFFPVARRRQTWVRPLYALNKPGLLREKPVVVIPERFRTVV